MDLEHHSLTHVGLKRGNNQDAILINEEQKVFCVADGLGGHLGGEVASALALDSFNEVIKQYASSQKKPEWIIQEAFHRANEDVFHQSQKHLELRGMGTTLVSLWLHKGRIYVGNVGDSRGYLYRDGQLWQLTEDHILCARHLKTGFSSQGDVQNLKQNSLTQSVGFLSNIKADIFVRDVKEKDIYLLCSDGLHGMVPDDVILEVFRAGDLKNIPEMCIIKALSHGGLDNISLVVVKIASCP